MKGWNEGWEAGLVETAAAIRRAGLRPVAAFDFDQTCIEGDLGAQFHLELSRIAAYPLESSSPLRDVLRETPEAKRLVSLLEGQAWEGDTLRAEMACLYTRVLKQRGSFEAAAWAPLLHAGFRESELGVLAETIWETLTQVPSTPCLERCGDGVEVRWNRGLRVRPKMVALIGLLEGAGVEVRVVSQTNIWALRPAMKALGLSADRAIGSRCEVASGLVQPRLVVPTTYREGKVLCHAAAAGADTRLLLAAGDSENDLALLHAAQVGLWVDRGDERHRHHAEANGWMLADAAWLMQED